MAVFKKILVPVDGSKHAGMALAQAVCLAELCGAALVLLYVVDLNQKISSFEQVSTGGYIPVEIKNEGEKLLADLRGKIPQTVCVQSVVAVGQPPDTIVETCLQGKYDLIVMGSRGLGKLERVFLGSVRQYVLTHAPCPVMIIR